ncbi:hypothetical protein FW774_03990 (plasmid) [Pedobacter sp. BS3]|uniref:hypothetical protein n=1 Tax=Pedobacter sp. BS3 TaxID=2567937 RepID=UPI0011EE66FE|nr:hypothetical protein [Pedobacter sp. BS3]TZF86220.1 hypothetical protein FW774_03990 [Pedobacter sp. BS3]
MIRTILKPTQATLQLQLPENLIGKLIEVIAFEIKESESGTEQQLEELKPSQLRGFLSAESSEAMHQHIHKSRAEWDI